MATGRARRPAGSGHRAAGVRVSRPPELLPYGDRALLVELAHTEEAVAYAAALRDRRPRRRGARSCRRPGPCWSVAAGRVRARRRCGRRLEDVTAGGRPTARGAAERVRRGPGHLRRRGPRRRRRADRVSPPTRSSPRTPARPGGSPSVASCRASATSSARTTGCTCRDGRSPAPACPPGAVGLAGEYSGVYPRTSPGGWQLIGRTDATLWDLDRDPPALLRPRRVGCASWRRGGVVSAVAARARHRPARARRRTWVARASPGSAWAAPVPPTGPPLCQGNRALANAERAAGIEVTFGGLEVEVLGERACWFCVTGAPCEVTRRRPRGRLARGVSRRRRQPGPPRRHRRRVCAPTSWSAAASPSRRCSGRAPATCCPGSVRPRCRGRRARRSAPAAHAFPTSTPCPRRAWDERGGAARGARPAGRLGRDADALVATAWEVTDRSNRVGMRLAGAASSRPATEQLPSEGVVARRRAGAARAASRCSSSPTTP